MFKVTAIKNGKQVLVNRLEVDKDGFVFAVYYKNEKGQISWNFPKDLDHLIIEFVEELNTN